MGAYKYISETLRKQYKTRDVNYRNKVISWRAGPAMVRVDNPANLARARRLGYQAKQGYIIVRTRVDKGRRTRRKPMGGRKHKNFYRFVQPQLSHQAIAEQRVNREYRNMEVLNSYWVGEDGNYKFFEVILADPSTPTVNISAASRYGKSFRGLTAAGNSRWASKKKSMNKRLRRKLAATKAFHYAPYVKKTVVAGQQTEPKRVFKTKAKSKEAKAKKEAEHEKSMHTHNPSHHPAHSEVQHTHEHKSEAQVHAAHHAEHKPAHTEHKAQQTAQHKKE